MALFNGRPRPKRAGVSRMKAAQAVNCTWYQVRRKIWLDISARFAGFAGARA
jgi:hypothetical protein